MFAIIKKNSHITCKQYGYKGKRFVLASEIKQLTEGVFHFDVAEKDFVQFSFSDTDCLIEINSDSAYRLSRDELDSLIIRGQSEAVSIEPAHSSAELKQIFDQLDIQQGYCVDIGAHNGISYSNTRDLFQNGWSGVLIEAEKHRFANLAHNYRLTSNAATVFAYATPENILYLLKAYQVPKNFDFLSIDIDSYDYYVLEALLTEFHPTVIIAEVNEVIPPPLKFSLRYGPDCKMNLEKRFYGQSLAQLQILCERFGYHMIHMHYMDVILIDQAYTEGDPQSLESLYQTGFKDLPQPPYYQDYPFDIERVQSADPDEALELIKAGFAEFEGQFTLEIESPLK